VDQEPQPNEQSAGDLPLKTLGIDPNKWTVGDRRIALLGVGIGLTIVIIAVCGYVFGWEWTGLAKRTFWDWLSLLIVPIVLALGGYLFNRSESRRTQDVAERQRTTDRQVADQRAQDDALQAYLDHIGELLLRTDTPLRQSEEGAEVRTLARARTLTVLPMLDGLRKRSVMQFLYEANLIRDHVVLDLRGANLRGAYLFGANLRGADLRGADLSVLFKMKSVADLGKAGIETDLGEADLRGANLRGTVVTEKLLEQAESLEGATMPDGQILKSDDNPDGPTFEEWLKSKARGKDGENNCPS
jgi:hypothetical protein